MDNLTKLLRAYGIDGYQRAASVAFNGVVYPLQAISVGMARFCRPLFHAAEGLGDSVSTKGSATFISVAGQFFAVITKHQYNLLSPEEVAFPAGVDRIMACGGDFFVPDKGECYGDELCYLDLGKHVTARTLRSEDFLPLKAANYCIPRDDVRHGVSYGFAFDDLEFEFDETGKHDFRMLALHTKLREYNVKYAGNSFDHTLCKWTREAPILEQLSGFSGGPTFAVVRNADGFVAKLAGINLMSNGATLHTVKVDTVARYLNSICANY